MPRPGLKPLLGILLSALLLLSAQAPAAARPGWLNRSSDATETLQVSPPNAGLLQEVAPPGAVQEIKRRLNSHHPQLQLLSPKADSVNKSSGLDLSLAVEDWPVSRDPELGLGPHVALQVDDQPLIRIDTLHDGRAQVHIDELGPGSHRFAAWAAYPWGEAVKSTGASLQWRLHQWQRLEGTQPQADAPWLVPNPMTGGLNQQPLLLDWQLWNAPLQNLRDGDARWRVRISLDGDSFLADHQDALWLKGSGGSKDATLQMELIDGRGEPLQPVFNNRLIRLGPARGPRPAWLKARLKEEEVLRLSGEPVPIPEETEQDIDNAAAPPMEVVQEPAPPVRNDPLTSVAQSTPADMDENDEDEETEPKPETSEAAAQEPEPQPAAADVLRTTPKPMSEQPVLRPESSLGGSARELLDADGRLRQP